MSYTDDSSYPDDGGYPDGDTYNDCYGPSGVAFKNIQPGAPDSRGFMAEHITVLAVGDRHIDPNGNVTSRIEGPPEGAMVTSTSINGGGA